MENRTGILRKKHCNAGLNIFLICFLSMIIILLPASLRNNGIFIFTGDYYMQQIPFYYHASETVKNLGVGWDWYTDLGTDFVTSYGFYLLGSVFFWAMVWLPSKILVYTMPVMIAVKSGLAGLGAFTYIKRYVKNDNAAFLGAYMYAFSGFQMVSLLYNHFYDVTALFPFLLVSFEMLVKENRKCVFALMVAVTACTNYFFFVGTVFFVILYYVIKCVKKEFVFTCRSFMTVVFESLTGVGIAGIILVPTCMIISASDRFSDILYGINLVSYDDNTIIPKILQSLFMLPDPLSDATLFLSSDTTHNWTTNSLYLPLFTVTAVWTYIVLKPKDWISVLLKCCFVMMIVPGLNSVFSLFNSSYYARWFYMPVLVMCLATSLSIEKNYDLKPGIKAGAAGVLVIALISLLPDKVVSDSDKLSLMLDSGINTDTEIKMFSISSVPVILWQYIAFSAVFLLIVTAYNKAREKDDKLLRKIIFSMAALNIITFMIFIDYSVMQTEVDEEMCIKSSVGFSPELNDDGIFRISHATRYSFDNSSMLWGYMNAGCFHSIEPNESDEFFYEAQGYRRWMQSQYREEDYPAYGLLSVKYLFNLSTADDLNVEIKRINVPGFSLFDRQGCYYIYKNDYYVPFGSVYRYYIDSDSLEKYLDENITENRYQYKKLVMMRALVLSKEDAEKYSEYIEKLPDSMLDSLNEGTYFSDCTERAEGACSSFDYGSAGFSAEVSTGTPGLVYFSVPCTDGWTAEINGEKTDIIKVHYGLTAVAVESGVSSIEFKYETPGLKKGIAVSAVFSGIYLIYVFITVLRSRTRKDAVRV